MKRTILLDDDSEAILKKQGREFNFSKFVREKLKELEQPVYA